MTEGNPVNSKALELCDYLYVRSRCKDIVTTATDIATKSRKITHPREIVQHTQKELIALYEIVCGWHNDESANGYYMQLGAFAGGSACVIADALKHSKSRYAPLLAIDDYTRDYAPMREQFNQVYVECRENIWAHGLNRYVNLIIGNDLDYLEHFANHPLHFVFIDSSHDYGHTLKEIDFIAPRLISGSWLIFDDYFSEKTPGVKQAVDEFLDGTTSTFESYRMEGLLILRRM